MEIRATSPPPSSSSSSSRSNYNNSNGKTLVHPPSSSNLPRNGKYEEVKEEEEEEEEKAASFLNYNYTRRPSSSSSLLSSTFSKQLNAFNNLGSPRPISLFQRFRSQSNILSSLGREQEEEEATAGNQTKSPSSLSTKTFALFSSSPDEEEGPKGGAKRKWFSFTNLFFLKHKSVVDISSLFPNNKSGKNHHQGPSSSSSSGGGGGGIVNEGFFPSSSSILSNNNNDNNTNSGDVVFRRNGKGMRPVVINSSCSTGSSGSGGGGGGVGSYYTGESSSSGNSRHSNFVRPNSSSSSSRLSCGEFFTGTPNSPNSETGPSRTILVEGDTSGGLLGESNSGPTTSYRHHHHHPFLGRSLPTLLESMESGIASQGGSSSDGGGTGGTGGGQSYQASTVDSVLDLMAQEYVVLTGAKSLDDHYILTFPDRGNFGGLGDEEYRRLILYLTAVPPMHDAESGFVLIVDRRNDKWNSVKSTLVRISNYFPGLIHRVLVLRPAGLFQKALSEISSKLFRSEALRFRLTVINSASDLTSFISPTQLTSDLGGLLLYDPVKWVQERMEVEAFHLSLHALSKDLKAFTEVFTDLEYPNDVTSTSSLLSDKANDYSRLRHDLNQASDLGEHLLFRIKHMESEANMASASPDDVATSPPAAKNSVQLINAISVQRYIIQIEETSRLFQEFWSKEKMSLEGCLQLRRFEQDFRELQSAFDLALKRLEKGLPDMGETLGVTEALIRETAEFATVSTNDLVVRAKELERIGRDIILLQCKTAPSVDSSVDPKCIELERMRTHFEALLRDKVLKQREWREIQAGVESANGLCNEGMDLVTMSSSSSSSSAFLDPCEDCVDGCSGGGGGASALVGRIDEYLDRIRNVMEELALLKGTVIPTSQTRPLVKQVLKRVEDVELMCIKRKGTLLQQISRANNKSRRSSGSSFASSTHSTSSQNSSTFGMAELKSAKSTSQLDSGIMTNSPMMMMMNLMDSPQRLRHSGGGSSLSLDGGGGGGGGGGRGCGKLRSSDPEWELKQIKRGYIINELIQTERNYVKEIGEVLTGYRDKLRNREFHHLLPPQLQPIPTPSKQDMTNPNVAVLFCNLDEIHDFHSSSLLPDLERYDGSIQLVALSLVERHSELLSLYGQYCQLLPASEILRKEIGENHPWFMECRNNLDHKLTLGSYLLKPVQRITKYHLLLKDLLDCSEGCVGYAEMREALECLLIVVRHVNDGMLQLAITNYPGKLIDEGYLLLQGPFMLWMENKKDLLWSKKGHRRHLFLYQRSILICKQVPKTNHYKFLFKLSLSEIGLTESLKDNKTAATTNSKKFGVWILEPSHKSYLLQAHDSETKEIWVREIKKLLQEQLEAVRAKKSQTIAACAAGASSSASNTPTRSSSTVTSRRAQLLKSKATNNGKNVWSRSASASGAGPSSTSFNLFGRKQLRQASSWDQAEGSVVVNKPSTDFEIDEDLYSYSEASNSEEDDDDEETCSVTPPLRNSRSRSRRPLSVGEDYFSSGDNEESPKLLLYRAVSSHRAEGPTQLSLKEGDVVIFIRQTCGGWWFVRKMETEFEGWVPSKCLDYHVRGTRTKSVSSLINEEEDDNNTNTKYTSSSKKDLNTYFLHPQEPKSKSRNLPPNSCSSSRNNKLPPSSSSSNTNE